MTTTINGLHRCQPKNEPQIGAIKTFLVIHNPAKGTKKAWIAIKSAAEDKGGTPYKIVSAEPTGFTDDYGNVSWNLEVEAVDGQQGETGHTYTGTGGAPQPRANAPQAPVQRQNGGGYGDILDTRQRAIIRQHSQSMALMVLDLKQKLGELSVEDLTPVKLRALADYFDADVQGATE